MEIRKAMDSTLGYLGLGIKNLLRRVYIRRLQVCMMHHIPTPKFSPLKFSPPRSVSYSTHPPSQNSFPHADMGRIQKKETQVLQHRCGCSSNPGQGAPKRSRLLSGRRIRKRIRQCRLQDQLHRRSPMDLSGSRAKGQPLGGVCEGKAELGCGNHAIRESQLLDPCSDSLCTRGPGHNTRARDGIYCDGIHVRI
jgi:hypothetical protein